MSSAFDIVDHGIMVDIFRWRFGIQGLATDWHTDFIAD